MFPKGSIFLRLNDDPLWGKKAEITSWFCGSSKESVELLPSKSLLGENHLIYEEPLHSFYQEYWTIHCLGWWMDDIYTDEWYC